MPKNISSYEGNIENQSVTIESGETVSDALDVFSTTIVKIETPAEMTGDTLTFQGSIDGGTTYAPVYYTFATEYSVSISTSEARSFIIDPIVLAGYDSIKIVSSSSEGADRVIKVKTKPLA